MSERDREWRDLPDARSHAPWCDRQLHARLGADWLREAPAAPRRQPVAVLPEECLDLAPLIDLFDL